MTGVIKEKEDWEVRNVEYKKNTAETVHRMRRDEEQERDAPGAENNRRTDHN